MLRLTIGLLAAALGVCTPVWSATPPLRAAAPKDRKPAISRPDWAALPSADDMARFFPEHAMLNGISGKATISCTVTVEGLLTDCSVVSESPPGENFGAAAVKMAQYFRMKPKTLDGTPVEGGRVRIPINFEAPISVGAGQGPPPPLPPATGPLTYVGQGELSQGGTRTLPTSIYLRLPETTPVDTKTVVWSVVVLPSAEGRTSYWQMAATFDCAGRRFSPDSVQVFVEPDTRLSWSGHVDAGWEPIQEPALIRTLDLVCGAAKADTPLLADIPAVLKDAASRSAAAGSN